MWRSSAEASARSWFQIWLRSSPNRGSSKISQIFLGCPNGMSMISFTRPGRVDSTATRSPMRIASSMLWVMKTIVRRFVSQICSSCSWRISRVCASTEANGSSINRTSGSIVSARARPTRCCIPPESWYGYFFSNPFEPTISTYRWPRSDRSSFLTPDTCRP